MSQNLSLLDEALPGIYPDLRLIARKMLRPAPHSPGSAATTLVHDAYLRLRDRELPWQGREHLLSTAAVVMRRILVDRARHGLTLRQGGDRQRVELVDEHAVACGDEQRLVDLDDALAALEALDPFKARLVELRFFAGLTIPQAARALEVSEPTVKKEWAVAKLWLLQRIESRATA